MERQKFDIAWETLWRILLFVVIIAILYQGRQIILGLFLAIIISSGLEGIVDRLEHVGLPRSISVILIFLLADRTHYLYLIFAHSGPYRRVEYDLFRLRR